VIETLAGTVYRLPVVIGFDKSFLLYIRHAMLSDPEEADISLPLAEIPILTSTIPRVSSFSI